MRLLLLRPLSLRRLSLRRLTLAEPLAAGAGSIQCRPTNATASSLPGLDTSLVAEFQRLLCSSLPSPCRSRTSLSERRPDVAARLDDIHKRRQPVLSFVATFSQSLEFIFDL
jgi:hypothetical protein